MTDWNDPTSMVSQHFSVRECTLLPSWGVLHQTSEEEQANLARTAQIMDQVRDLLGKPMRVHCWIRPTAANCPGSEHDGGNYNVAAGSTATHSAHISGLAVDFDIGEDCDTTRATLMPHLESLGLRMEDRPHSDWVHLDIAEVPAGGHRFFIP
jgi:hypothetical protein